MDEEVLKRRVAGTVLELVGVNPDFSLQDVAKGACVEDIDLVTWALEELGLRVSGDKVIWSQPKLLELKRVALLKRSKTGATTVNNTVNNQGNNVQAAAGGDVSGTMNVQMSYEHVLNQLVQGLEKANLPPEKKSKIKDYLGALLKETSIKTLAITAGELLKPLL